MRFIKPNNISGEIMTLFDEAETKVVIVSPYVKISKWYKLKKKLQSLKERGIEIEFFVRDEPDNQESVEHVRAEGIEPILLPNLHAKLYMNEKEAIVSSMNLHLGSEIQSLELAYKTETRAEYNELQSFYRTYLEKHAGSIVETQHADLKNLIHDALLEEHGKIHLQDEVGCITIKTKQL